MELALFVAELVAIWFALRASPMAPGVPYKWGAYCAYRALLASAHIASGYFTGLERRPAGMVI